MRWICVFEKNLQCPSHGGQLHRHFLLVTREPRAPDYLVRERSLSHHEPALPVRTASQSGGRALQCARDQAAADEHGSLARCRGNHALVIVALSHEQDGAGALFDSPSLAETEHASRRARNKLESRMEVA